LPKVDPSASAQIQNLQTFERDKAIEKGFRKVQLQADAVRAQELANDVPNNELSPRGFEVIAKEFTQDEQKACNTASNEATKALQKRLGEDKQKAIDALK